MMRLSVHTGTHQCRRHAGPQPGPRLRPLRRLRPRSDSVEPRMAGRAQGLSGGLAAAGRAAGRNQRRPAPSRPSRDGAGPGRPDRARPAARPRCRRSSISSPPPCAISPGPARSACGPGAAPCSRRAWPASRCSGCRPADAGGLGLNQAGGRLAGCRISTTRGNTPLGLRPMSAQTGRRSRADP